MKSGLDPFCVLSFGVQSLFAKCPEYDWKHIAYLFICILWKSTLKITTHSFKENIAQWMFSSVHLQKLIMKYGLFFIKIFILKYVKLKITENNSKLNNEISKPSIIVLIKITFAHFVPYWSKKKIGYQNRELWCSLSHGKARGSSRKK